MASNDPLDFSDSPENLERIQWLDETEFKEIFSSGKPADLNYETFDEIRNAILADGSIYLTTNRVNLVIEVLSGRFDNEIMIVRQSGLNIRRFLVREKSFEETFGNFENCINHHMSNNAVDCEIEIAHIKDFLDHAKIDCEAIDFNKEYSRIEIDAVAAQQLINIKNALSNNDQTAGFLFSLGYSVGRVFSGIQNLATFEELARKGSDAEKNYKQKGKNSGSDKRKMQRLNSFISEIEKVYKNNPEMRKYEGMILRAAFDITVPEGSYGHGRYEEYCSIICSENPYKKRFDKLFRQVT